MEFAIQFWHNKSKEDLVPKCWQKQLTACNSLLSVYSTACNFICKLQSGLCAAQEVYLTVLVQLGNLMLEHAECSLQPALHAVCRLQCMRNLQSTVYIIHSSRELWNICIINILAPVQEVVGHTHCMYILNFHHQFFRRKTKHFYCFIYIFDMCYTFYASYNWYVVYFIIYMFFRPEILLIHIFCRKFRPYALHTHPNEYYCSNKKIIFFAGCLNIKYIIYAYNFDVFFNYL